MGVLSSFDREAVSTLRSAGVLEEVDAHAIDMTNGVIVVRCPDCDQRSDAERHDQVLATANGGRDRFHLLPHHGGAAVAAPGSPLYPEFDLPGYLGLQIREAEGLKSIKTVLLEVHAPCGKGEASGFNIVQLITLMFLGKPNIRAIDPTNEIVCRVHIDYGDRKRTYFVSRAKWMAFWNQRGRELWGHLFEVDPYPPTSLRVATVRRSGDRASVEEEDLHGPTPIPMDEASEGAMAVLAASRRGPSDTQLALEASRGPRTD